jgi:hypothetical protein
MEFDITSEKYNSEWVSDLMAKEAYGMMPMP